MGQQGDADEISSLGGRHHARSELCGGGRRSGSSIPHLWKRPLYLPPAFTWTGFHVGANAGYGFGQATTNIGCSADMDGFAGGGQIGYNYQMGQFVLGLEARLQAADLSVSGPGGSIKTDYFATVRGRAGVAFDRFMPYITGGWAYVTRRPRYRPWAFRLTIRIAADGPSARASNTRSPIISSPASNILCLP